MYKSQAKRYKIIDRIINQRVQVSRDALLVAVNQSLPKPVSQSQIDKDIKAMIEEGAPIKTINKKYYYTKPYVWMNGIDISKEEKQALDFAIGILNGVGGIELAQVAKSVINRVDSKMILSDGVSSVISGEGNLEVKGIEWLEILFKAIGEKRALNIKYQSPRRTAVHEFSPYALKEYEGLWYVIGYSTLRNFTVVFALHKIQDIEEPKVALRYYKDPEYDSQNYFKHSIGVYQYKYNSPEKVRLQVTREKYDLLTYKKLHSSQKRIEEANGWVTLEVEVYLSPDLKRTLLNWGADVKALSPKQLVDEMKEEVEKMAKLYR